MASRFCPDPEKSRAEILTDLRRQLSPTAPKGGAARPPLSTGWTSIDARLGGGLPRGRLVEVCGCAGRMTLALRALASATALGLETAFVDGPNALDVRAAQGLGVALSRLLWVRLPRPDTSEALQIADLLLAAGGYGLVVIYLCDVPVGRGGPRIPWQRLVQRAEKAGTAVLLVGDQPLTGSFAAARIQLRAAGTRWARSPGGRARLHGRQAQAHMPHSRLGPPGEAGLIELGR